MNDAISMNTINKKFLVPMLSLAVVLLSGLGIFMARHNNSSMLAMMESRGNVTADIITKFSSEYYAIYDIEDFENFVKALKSDPEIEFAAYFNSDREPITKFDKDAADNSQLLIFDREIKDEEGNINGYLRFGYHQKILAKSQSENVIIITVSVVVAIILFSLALVLFIRRIITHPIKQTNFVIKELEAGRLDSRLQMTQADEIGQMARTIDSFADSLQSEIVDAMQKLAHGNLTFEVLPKNNQDIIRGSLKIAGDNLNRIMSQVNQVAVQVATASGEISSASRLLSQGATAQAASIEEISSSMVELASQTKQNAEYANKANQVSRQTKSAAENGNIHMQTMVQAMEAINEASNDISKIIKVIDEIAFQTNLLALNAAVEAARAGRHGKGFAVVAEEVRNLAARSAKAARETAELIEGSVDKSTKGTEIANQTADALKEIVNGITDVSDLAEEIASASNEQAMGFSQVNDALAQVDQITHQNTSNAEEYASSSKELSAQAGQLRDILAQFTVKDEFKEQNSHQPALSHSQPEDDERDDFWNDSTPHNMNQNDDHDEAVVLDDQEFGKY